MSLLPIFLKLDGRPGLMVGAGNIALEKIGTLLKTGVRLRVIAPEARVEIQELANQGALEWIPREFQVSDLVGNFVVITATDRPEVNAQVYRESVARGILVNSVDDIPHCDFFFASIVSRGDLQIAISTSGESPALAQRLRREIDEQLPRDLGPWLSELGKLRRGILEAMPRSEERRLLLHELAHRQTCEPSTCPARNIAPAAQKPLPTKGRSEAGHVYLVGAGPGDPDLLTVKATRLIASSDVILHDDLVPSAILRLAPPQAVVVNVGKRCGTKSITQGEINSLMIEHAGERKSVVRLKSGDPMLFGRAAEEIAALAQAGIPFEIVPGISAAFAAAAELGCSLTDRNWASNVILSTGHHAQSHNHAPLPALEDATRVVYMPGRDLALLAEQWLEEGLPPELPCALVSHATQPEQQVIHTTLEKLGEAALDSAPSLLLAGWALQPAAHRDTDQQVNAVSNSSAS